MIFWKSVSGIVVFAFNRCGCTWCITNTKTNKRHHVWQCISTEIILGLIIDISFVVCCPGTRVATVLIENKDNRNTKCCLCEDEKRQTEADTQRQHRQKLFCLTKWCNNYNNNNNTKTVVCIRVNCTNVFAVCGQNCIRHTEQLYCIRIIGPKIRCFGNYSRYYQTRWCQEMCTKRI